MVPSFVYITISGLIFVASMIAYKLKLLNILNEKVNNQKPFFYITDRYLFFSKMQKKSLKSRAEIDFFLKWSTTVLSTKAVENSFVLYSESKNLTKSGS